MLARRLLVIALVMFAVSVIAAGLAPPPPGDEQAPPAPSSTGGAKTATIKRTIDAGRQRPRTITVRQGDLLTLTVTSPEADAIELQGLGAVRAVAPETPVVFDVLTDAPGSYPVILVGEERTVGTVRVLSAKAPKRPPRARPDALPTPRTTDT